MQFATDKDALASNKYQLSSVLLFPPGLNNSLLVSQSLTITFTPKHQLKMGSQMHQTAKVII